MPIDLHRTIRGTYNEAAVHHRNPRDAFEAAVEVFCRERPDVSVDQARREVARMLAMFLLNPD
jgi:hypothetical protein